MQYNKIRSTTGLIAHHGYAALLFLGLAALGSTLTSCGFRDPRIAVLGRSDSTVTSGVANNKVDILWIIDNSGTMGPKQTSLRNSINSFMNSFVSKNFDYRIAITTTDTRAVDPLAPNDPNLSGQAACFVGSPTVVEASTPNPATEVSDNANVGFFGSSDAHGLDAVELALSEPNLSNCNSGFFREDAYLAVIFFSDADDNTAATVSGLTTFLDGIKTPFTLASGSTIRSWNASAMVVDDVNDPDCIALGPASEYGSKYIELANNTGGQVASICAPDFSAGLLNVATKILEASTAIRLSRTPDPGTIAVFKNGEYLAQSATNGWTYEASINSIVFHGSAIPDGPNIPINVFYTPNDIIR
ncbi:MAG TPA: hypothetical protein PLH57_05415 [Oligoflexia bacterium]|nr:hypothetical protein [Oligoflexia bacterium]